MTYDISSPGEVEGPAPAQGLFVNVRGMSVVGVVALLRHSEPLPSSIASLPASIEYLQVL
jgi:hypothetical protein